MQSADRRFPPLIELVARLRLILRPVHSTVRLHRCPDCDEECELVLYSVPTHRSHSDCVRAFFLFAVWVPSLRSHGNLCCSGMGLVRITPPSTTQFASSSSRASHHHERAILTFPQKEKNQLLFSPAQAPLSRSPATNEYFDSPRTR